MLLLLCCSNSALSQIVRGTIVDETTNAPLSGVFVVLLDSIGRMRAGTLTDQKGFYAMRAPHAGSYTLRAERIGHRSTTTAPFVLSEPQAQSVDIRVPVAAIALAPIDVKAAKRCELRGDQGRRTAQLWEEARKALTVTQWVKTEAPIRFESRLYTRELDPYTLEVRTESMKHSTSTATPYRALSPDSLVRYGFVQNVGNDVIFYGPDADVLLSDIFLEEHCFRAVNGNGEREGFVGLAFEPVRDRELRDITGTLWLDAKNFELRSIEYRYTNLPRRLQHVRTLGGRTDFKRLQNGAWIVERWYIRMPMAAMSPARDVVVRALREEGGEVLSISESEATVQLRNDGAVRGSVYDSVRGRPLANTTVYLSGTSHRAVTDANGNYLIKNVPEGLYVIAFTHPVLDSLPAFPLPRSVVVQPKDTTRLSLAIPAVDTQMRDKCGAAYDPSPAHARTSGALFGYVYDVNGNAIADAEVAADVRKTKTDASGRYHLCELPLRELITIVVSVRESRVAQLQTRILDLPFKRIDLVAK